MLKLKLTEILKITGIVLPLLVMIIFSGCTTSFDENARKRIKFKENKKE